MKNYSERQLIESDITLPKKEWKTLLFLASENEGGDYTPDEFELPYTEDKSVKNEFVKNLIAKEINTHSRSRKPYLFGYFTVVRHVSVLFEKKEIVLIDHEHNTESVVYVFDTIEGNNKKYQLVQYKDVSSHITVSDFYSKEEIAKHIHKRPNKFCFIFAKKSTILNSEFKKFVLASKL